MESILAQSVYRSFWGSRAATYCDLMASLAGRDRPAEHERPCPKWEPPTSQPPHETLYTTPGVEMDRRRFLRLAGFGTPSILLASRLGLLDEVHRVYSFPSKIVHIASLGDITPATLISGYRADWVERWAGNHYDLWVNGDLLASGQAPYWHRKSPFVVFNPPEIPRELFEFEHRLLEEAERVSGAFSFSADSFRR